MAVDTAQVERILDNLVGNAIKHAPGDSEVWISAHPFEEGVLIKVEDSGPGVPEGLRETIFEPFRQGPDDQNTPGVGIGLSLVSRFAGLHGGRAWVGERPGGGASFCVYIPDGEPESVEDEDDHPLPQ
jgi:two-component system sensor histidine kinase KdpD